MPRLFFRNLRLPHFPHPSHAPTSLPDYGGSGTDRHQTRRQLRNSWAATPRKKSLFMPSTERENEFCWGCIFLIFPRTCLPQASFLFRYCLVKSRNPRSCKFCCFFGSSNAFRTLRRQLSFSFPYFAGNILIWALTNADNGTTEYELSVELEDW